MRSREQLVIVPGTLFLTPESMIFTLATMLLSVIPLDLPIVDQVDVIETNHFYDDQARHVFDQLVFYEWSRRDSRYQICDWRLIKSPTQVPQKDEKRNLYTVTWHDGQVLRQVRAISVRETWTQFDPELIERQFLPKEWRKELTKLVKPPLIIQSSN